MVELFVLIILFFVELLVQWWKASWKVMIWMCKIIAWCICFIFAIVWTVFMLVVQFIIWVVCRIFNWQPPRFDFGKKKKPMTGIDFENYCCKYLLTHGFHDVYTTPPSGDYGADLVAKDANGVTWVFQCKHYKSKVGNSCVQEVVAAKNHYGASKAAVMTNSQLTQKARELAFENDVILFECID